MNQSTSKTANAASVCRRLAALLATLALLASMTLPVYAEALENAATADDTQTTASEVVAEDPTTSEDNSTPDTTGAGDTTDDAGDTTEDDNSGDTDETPADDITTPDAPTEDDTQPDADDVDDNDASDSTQEPAQSEEEPTDVVSADDLANLDEDSVSTQKVLDGEYVYFLAPANFSDNWTVAFNASKETGKNNWIKVQMEDLGRIGTSNRRVFSMKLDSDACPYNGYARMQFIYYEGDVSANKYKDEIYVFGQYGDDWKSKDNFVGKIYDPDANTWTNYIPVTPGDHTAFAEETMMFENQSGKDLSNVAVFFYEPDNTVYKNVKVQHLGAVGKGKRVTFTIPSEKCSSIAFNMNAVSDDGTSSADVTKRFNFYGDEDTDNDNVSYFTYNSTNKFCYVYHGNKATDTWGVPEGTTTVYFDATFSKLSYKGSFGDYESSLPNANNQLYYCLKKPDGTTTIGDDLATRVDDSDIWSVEVPEGFTEIRFSGWSLKGQVNNTNTNTGSATDWKTIPTNLGEPCFVADTGDKTVNTGNTILRGGYWAEKGTFHDAEATTGTDIVDIKEAAFVNNTSTKYVTSTLYDYYSDWELNGNNRDTYTDVFAANHLSWVPFRQFDQAVSDYYKTAGTSVKYPIYTGHFQPTGMGKDFNDIAGTLGLFGWSNYKPFIAANNSNYDAGDGIKKYAYAFQGIVGSTLVNGNPVMNGTTDLVEPHFNEDFLTKTNSKNAKLGEVYHDVAFPFTKQEVFADEQGVKYWWFDSSKTSLYLRKDGSKLYLGNDDQDTTAGWTDSKSCNVNSSSGTTDSNGKTDISTEYGFFPFNETATSKNANTYNYGYGAKLEIPFTLTSDGTVQDKYGDSKPIRFYFSGDDDVWVFIDGKLVLDIGGAHGKVSGILEFDKKNGVTNTVTSYVSQSKYHDDYADYGAGNSSSPKITSITYLDKVEDYYKKESITIDNLYTGQHKLTMYYMERGMWESNMAVAFNFPDHNELEVEKKVDTTSVNELFQNFYTNADNTQFTFNIKNLATHYDPMAAAGSTILPLNLKVTDYTPSAGWTGNTCAAVTNPTDHSSGDVIQWHARQTDTSSAWRDRRYGTLTLNELQNIADKQYLSFWMYCNDNNTTGYSLDRIYLQLVDSGGKTLGGDEQYIGSAVYGNVSLVKNQWCKVTLDLGKLTNNGFASSNLAKIRFGCDYDRCIYWKDFTFTGTAASSDTVGFIKDQALIPDYGSVTKGTLQNATGALYTSNARTGTFAVDNDGEFVLKNNETIRFEDQFRRGSYLSITETPNDSYETYWTVYENGSPVTSMGTGKTVDNGSVKSLEKQDGYAPDDGRTEKADENTVAGSYNGTKPNAKTLVFRSYANPDSGDEGTLTKLKVQFVNKVKVGSLTIKKEGAVDSDAANLNGEYTFNITFSNIGGTGSTQTVTKDVTLKCGDEKTIDGIPLNTDYTITEVLPNDNSRLAEITVNGTPVSGDTAKGTITNTGTAVKVVFKNTKKPLIDLTVEKLWENEQGTDLTDGLPDSIFIQLQRYVPDSDKWEPVPNQDDNRDYVEISPDYATGAWKHTFTTLDKVVDYAKGDMRDWQYRVVEGTVKDGEFTASGNTITFGEGTNQKQFTISSSAAAGQGSEATTTEDGTISGGSGTITLTNKLQDPRFNLKVIKADAENTNTKLKDVEFKLEKLITGTDGSLIVDTAFSPIMGTTNVNGILLVTKDGQSVEGFTELEAGIYQLTEIKAADGYNLLSGPIKIEFTKDGECYLNNSKIEVSTTEQETEFSKNTTDGSYTLALTVLNRKVPELPHTGADAPSLWLLIGLPLAVAGLLILVFRYNKKGGRTK